MAELTFHTLDVFTDTRFGGNPLAVVFGGDALDAGERQRIAREFNLSETVFVVAAREGGLRRLFIHTPARELPFAGHPTVGAAWLLRHLGIATTPSFVLEETVGPIAIEVRGDGAGASIEFTTAIAPREGPPAPARAALAAIVGLAEDDVLDGAEAWSCGVPYLIVPVRDAAALDRARPILERWSATLKDYWTPDVFLVAVDPARADVVHARMFAPELGILEDPATGAAVADYAGWLARRAPDGEHRWIVMQGEAMGRPSRIELTVDVRGARATRVRIGGTAVLVSEGRMVG